MKSPKTLASAAAAASCPLLLTDVCWDSFRSWRTWLELEEVFVVTAAEEEFDCRCEEENAVSLTILRWWLVWWWWWLDVVMRREAWNSSRLWRKIFVGLKRGRAKKEGYDERQEQRKYYFLKNWPFCITQNACSQELPPDITNSAFLKKKVSQNKTKKKQLTISTDCHTSSRFNLTMYKHQPVILHRISNVLANIGQDE